MQTYLLGKMSNLLSPILMILKALKLEIFQLLMIYTLVELQQKLVYVDTSQYHLVVTGLIS
ncbi:hypothetical protein A8A12_14275 [Serratia marcescens]|nr:hypothetical protein A8A12_14275 [Serratia marcescens]